MSNEEKSFPKTSINWYPGHMQKTKRLIKENINLKGEKVTIKLVLTNVLMDLLFECYDIGSYELGFCVCYQGSYHLFDNYINFWSDVKKNNKGAMRQTAKNRLNTWYGKFGSSAESEITELGVEDDIFKMIHYKDYYVRIIRAKKL